MSSHLGPCHYTECAASAKTNHCESAYSQSPLGRQQGQLQPQLHWQLHFRTASSGLNTLRLARGHQRLPHHTRASHNISAVVAVQPAGRKDSSNLRSCIGRVQIISASPDIEQPKHSCPVFLTASLSERCLAKRTAAAISAADSAATWYEDWVVLKAPNHPPFSNPPGWLTRMDHPWRSGQPGKLGSACHACWEGRIYWRSGRLASTAGLAPSG